MEKKQQKPSKKLQFSQFPCGRQSLRHLDSQSLKLSARKGSSSSAVVLNSFGATGHQPNKKQCVDYLNFDNDKLGIHSKHFGLTYIVFKTEFQEII